MKYISIEYKDNRLNEETNEVHIPIPLFKEIVEKALSIKIDVINDLKITSELTL